MTTTVHVREDTRRLLDRLERQLGLAGYDEVIRKLVVSSAGHPQSLFRTCTGSHPLVREKEDEHVV